MCKCLSICINFRNLRKYTHNPENLHTFETLYHKHQSRVEELINDKKLPQQDLYKVNFGDVNIATRIGVCLIYLVYCKLALQYQYT